MTTQERVMEATKLRLRFQMNNRLRLESLAALSRVFREHQEPVGDELLASLVLAVPEELLGEMDTGNGSGATAAMTGVPKATPVPRPDIPVPRSTPVPKSDIPVPRSTPVPKSTPVPRSIPVPKSGTAVPK